MKLTQKKLVLTIMVLLSNYVTFAQVPPPAAPINQDLLAASLIGIALAFVFFFKRKTTTNKNNTNL